MLKLLKKIFAPDSEAVNNSKLSELTITIFERAMHEKASDLIFGVPPGEDYNHEANKVFKREVDEETREFAESQGLEVKEPEDIYLAFLYS